MRISDAQLEVVVPIKMRHADSQAFVRENAEWVLGQLEKIERGFAEFPPARLRDGGSVAILGQACPIRVTLSKDARRHVARYDSGEISVSAARPLEIDEVSRSVKKLLGKITAEIARARAAHWCDQTRFWFRRLRVSDSKSSWGSCTSQGDLAFSWRLAMAPAEVFDYVVLHEVVHLRHFSHNPAFWAEVKRHLPGYKNQVAWLESHGHALRLSS